MSAAPYVDARELDAALKGHETEILDQLGIDWRAGGAPCPYPNHKNGERIQRKYGKVDDAITGWCWEPQRARAKCTCIERRHPDDILAVASKVLGLYSYENTGALYIWLAEHIGRGDLIHTTEDTPTQRPDEPPPEPAPGRTMSGDSLTVLTSVNRRLASKTFSRGKDGKIKNRSYGSEKYFSVTSIEITGISELARALEELSRNPHAFVVRGAPLPGIDLRRTRRLLHPDKNTGEPATFTEVPRRWALVDVDEIACPAAIDPKSDPEDAVEHVIGLLPAELHDAWCWWQLSSSQSVFSDTTISMHLWVWLDAPLGGDELKRWAIAANQSAGHKLIDPALFSAVQAHYVAAPDFVAPLPDPLPRRCGLRQGLDDSVSLIIPPPHPKRRDEFGTEGYEPGRGVKAYLDTIGGPAGFRGPIKKAIASYIAMYGSKADCGPLKAAIRRALDRAEPDWRKDPKGARYTDDEHLDDIIAAIRAFQGDKPGKGSQPEPPPWLDDPPPAEPEERDDLDPDPPDEDIGPLPAEFSDEALALQFTAYHQADWRYVALWGKWMQWLGTYWRSEDTLHAFELARRVCRRNSPQAALINPKLGREVARAGTVAGVERLARADRRHAMTFDQWNADDWSINQSTPEEGMKAHDPRPANGARPPAPP